MLLKAKHRHLAAALLSGPGAMLVEPFVADGRSSESAKVE